DSGHGPQLLRGELPAGDADPHHEEAVLDLGVLEGAGPAALDAGPALGIQAPPAEPPAQVGRVDGREALLGVPVDDPVPDVQPGVVLLEALGWVERLEVAQGPLALAPPLRRWHADISLLLGSCRGAGMESCRALPRTVRQANPRGMPA